MADLSSLVVKLEAQTAQYDAKLDQATKKLRSFSKSTNDVLKNFAGAFAAAFTVDKLVNFGKAALENADHLNKLAQSSGVGVEALSKLQFAAKQSGVDTEALGVGLKKLNVSISEAAGNAKSDAAVAFKAMGISVTDSAGKMKTADVIVAELANKFAGYKDGANKVAIAQTLVGKSGAAMIPFFNQGADGLAKLGDQAQRAGAVLSKETAAAAEEFNDKVSLLKTTLITGLGAQIAQKLLPTLNDLADQFLNTADGARELGGVADFLATGLKGLLSVGLLAGRIVQGLGNSLGATAAIIVQSLKGNFSAAAEIIRQRNADGIKEDENFQKRIHAIWQAGGDQVLRDIKVTARKIGQEAPNLLGKKEIEQAVQEALKKLSTLRDGLQDQVFALDHGAVAVQRYKLEHGELAKALALTGAAGAKLAAKILDSTKALELHDVKNALAEIDSQIKALQGDTTGAALAGFDREHLDILKKLADLGNTQGPKDIARLRELTAAQAEFNDLQKQAEKIQTDLAIAEERIANTQRVGAITELDALKQLGEARAQAAGQLDEIAKKESDIAKASGNPDLVENAKKFRASVADLASQTDLLGEKVRSVFEDSFGNGFADVITGAKTAGDAIHDFLLDIERQFASLIAKNFAEKLFGGLLGGKDGGGGILGSLGGALSGLLGGAHADGGTIPAGKIGLVGERGPELVFAGATSMNVTPNKKIGGQTIYQSFTVQAPGGVVSRASQMQIAAAAARGLAQANRRNN